MSPELSSLDLMTVYKTDGIFDGRQYMETNNKWKDMLVPVEMRIPGGEPGEDTVKHGLHLDLNTLIKVLDEHSSETQDVGSDRTWQLVIIQAILLSVLVLVTVTWVFCCKKSCCKSSDDSATRVGQALRKMSSASLKSRDFPPSYSQADLHTLAMSVHDYLYPPPDYPDVFNRTADDLAYLDLEEGHRRMSRLSFSRPNSPPPPFGAITPQVQRSSHSSQGHRSPLSPKTSVTLEGLGGHHAQLSRQSTWSSTSSSDSRRSSLKEEGGQHTRKSSLKDPASRRSSLNSESRRGSQSRISFNESVECSNGSLRRLSGSQGEPQLSRQSSNSSIPYLSRQSSNSSIPPLSRQSSNSSMHSGVEVVHQTNLISSRKLGLSQESLNEELMRKLESIEQPDESSQERQRNSLETVIEVENH